MKFISLLAVGVSGAALSELQEAFSVIAYTVYQDQEGEGDYSTLYAMKDVDGSLKGSLTVSKESFLGDPVADALVSDPRGNVHFDLFKGRSAVDGKKEAFFLLITNTGPFPITVSSSDRFPRSGRFELENVELQPGSSCLGMFETSVSFTVPDASGRLIYVNLTSYGSDLQRDDMYDIKKFIFEGNTPLLRYKSLRALVSASTVPAPSAAADHGI